MFNKNERLHILKLRLKDGLIKWKTILGSTDSETDMGVMIDNQLYMNFQCNTDGSYNRYIWSQWVQYWNTVSKSGVAIQKVFWKNECFKKSSQELIRDWKTCLLVRETQKAKSVQAVKNKGKKVSLSQCESIFMEIRNLIM